MNDFHIVTPSASQRLREFHIVNTNGHPQDVTERLDLGLDPGPTRNPPGSASSLSESSAPARTPVVSANITASSALSRSVIRRVTNDTHQPAFSDILPST